MHRVRPEVSDTRRTTIPRSAHDIPDAITHPFADPGALRAILARDLKKGQTVQSTEALVQVKGFPACEGEIVSVMHSQAGHDGIAP